MIRGLHGLFYSSDAEATRAFLRDQLALPYSDVGEGWLIFDVPEADVGVHPIDEAAKPAAGAHDVSFWCDDIEGTVADLRGRGVVFEGRIEDRGYGLVTHFTMPGGIVVQLYEPKYQKRRARRSTRRHPARRSARRTRSARRSSSGHRGAARRKRPTR